VECNVVAEDQASGTEEAGETGASAAADPSSTKPRRVRAKPKTSARALARAEALSAAGGVDAFAELVQLRRAFEQLTQGLQAMLQTQLAHAEQLRALLAAATAPTGPEAGLMRALEYISNQIAEQGGRFADLESALNRLPETVAAAVGAQMAAGLAAVR
jgi:hypothetical protein